jgi:hypothetical protein
MVKKPNRQSASQHITQNYNIQGTLFATSTGNSLSVVPVPSFGTDGAMFSGLAIA